jgi:hypothetical protein
LTGIGDEQGALGHARELIAVGHLDPHDGGAPRERDDGGLGRERPLRTAAR